MRGEGRGNFRVHSNRLPLFFFYCMCREDKCPEYREGFVSIVMRGVDETSRRRNQGGCVGDIDRKTMKNILKRTKCTSTHNAQVTTKARDRERNDPRNFFVKAALLEVFQKFLSPANVINKDDVGYSVGPNGVKRITIYDPDFDCEAPVEIKLLIEFAE